jgi:excisionase family DNA binding protein
MDELLQESRDLINQLDVMPQLLKYKNVADFLGVREETVRKWVSTGKIEHAKIGSAVRFRCEYLKEYITIRDMMFMVCLDFMIIQKQDPTEWQSRNKNETCKKGNYIYNHLIAPSVNGYQSWLMGKVLIQGNTVKKTHFDSHEEFESYITGYDSEGNLRIESCSPDNDDSFLRPVYFSRGVLD